MKFLLHRGCRILRGITTAVGQVRCCVGMVTDAGLRCQSGRGKEGIVVIMGATGTGKSKLSIDLAGRFLAEVVNSDKIQVYRGLDITTNKMPIHERRGVPHHLLGDLNPAEEELTPAGFRSLSAAIVKKIVSQGKVPLVAGGSNSYIHAMMVDEYDPGIDPFDTTSARRHRFRYRNCLLWVDADPVVLEEYLDKRVDEMVELGMAGELERYFDSGESERHEGLGKAIGVSEFRRYFRQQRTTASYQDAIDSIKLSTRRLAKEQLRKIKLLREMDWPLQRMDATATIVARLTGGGKDAEAAAWDRDVLDPSLRAVERFVDQSIS